MELPSAEATQGYGGENLSRVFVDQRPWRRWSSRWAIFWAIAELSIGLVVLLFLGNFIADHITQLHLALSAIVLHLYVIASLVIIGRQVFWIYAIDYQRPILEIRQRLETLRIERLRALKLILLSAPLLRILMLIVGVEALTPRISSHSSTRSRQDPAPRLPAPGARGRGREISEKGPS